MRNQILIAISAFCIAACSSKPNEVLSIQGEFLDSLINIEYERLHERVYTSGYTSVGGDYLKRSIDSIKKYESIVASDEIEEVRELTSSLIETIGSDEIANYPTTFLVRSLKQLNESNLPQFKLNIKLYIVEVLKRYDQEVSSKFYMFDLVQPILITESNSIVHGTDFNAQISMESGMSAINPEIYVKFKEKDYALLDVIGGRGKLNIRTPPVGTHSMTIRIEYLSNLKKRTAELEYQFEVTN